MTANPLIVNDSIYVTYIEDKDAGSYLDVEGERTENPVRCWLFHKRLIPGVEERNIKTLAYNNISSTIFSGPLILPKDKNCKVLDITGRKISTVNPVPGIYFIVIEEKIRQKVIKIK